MATLYRWTYSTLLYLLTPLIICRLLLRGRKAPAYRDRWGERFAHTLPEHSPGVIWFHTVSVGETLAALPVIKHTLAQYPEQKVLVTTMTPTGSDRVRASLGDTVAHVYAPYDLPHAMARFYKHYRPRCLCIMETELWPNMLHQAKIHHVPVVLMNARMSEKSARGYRRFKTLTQDMMAKLSTIAVQNATDAERFESLGASKEQLQVTGNIKFDLTMPPDLATKQQVFSAALADRPVWLAASTHLGEDDILVDAHRQLLQQHPDACLIIVPRHPERFEEVYQIASKTGLSVHRRTADEQPDSQIYLVDTMGELLLFSSLADMAFVGGSLIERGGHNCLEVSAFAKPVMSGKHDFNFADINKQLVTAGGLVYVADSGEICQQLTQWIENPALASETGRAGLAVVERNRGALGKLIEILTQHFTD